MSVFADDGKINGIRRLEVKSRDGEMVDTFVVATQGKKLKVSVDRLGFTSAYTRAITKYCELNSLATTGQDFQQMLTAKRCYLEIERDKSQPHMSAADSILEAEMLASIAEYQSKKKTTIF